MITPVSPGSAYTSPISGGSPTQNTQAFAEVLRTMLTLQSASSSGAGMDAQPLTTSLMILLLEQILASQTQAGASSGFRTPTVSASQATPSGRPVQGGTLTQEYHAGHHGLDFGVAVGTSVFSTLSGEVVYAGWNDQGYGNLVIVENGNYRTYYAHLSQIPVRVGQAVKAGQVIGLSGNTGNSTGPHLHYEIRQNGVAIDPTALTLHNGSAYGY